MVKERNKERKKERKSERPLICLSLRACDACQKSIALLVSPRPVHWQESRKALRLIIHHLLHTGDLILVVLGRRGGRVDSRVYAIGCLSPSPYSQSAHRDKQRVKGLDAIIYLSIYQPVLPYFFSALAAVVSAAAAAACFLISSGARSTASRQASEQDKGLANVNQCPHTVYIRHFSRRFEPWALTVVAVALTP